MEPGESLKAAEGRKRPLDIFFLNSFAGDYSSAITALTKRKTVQNRQMRGAEGGKPECAIAIGLSTSRIGDFTGPRNFDEEKEHARGRESDEEANGAAGGKGGAGGG